MTTDPDEIAEQLRQTVTDQDNIVIFDDRYDPTKVGTHKQKPGRKPSGIWYACGLDWIDWVLSEMPGWFSTNIYSLKIDKEDVRQIKTEDELVRFSRHWMLPNKKHWSQLDYPRNSIDWPSIANDYKGIEICPYQRSLRFDDSVGWYYGWDVASGCIWDTSCIISVDELYVV